MLENKQRCRIVIMGRPNTGKSTLFNRLIGRRKALVHDLPGVTRDRNEEKTEWWVKGKKFPVLLVDTGGLGGESFKEEIQKQVQLALEEADVILFLGDSQAGLTPLDEELFRELQRSGLTKKIRVIGVVNKVDDHAHEDRIADFYQLEFDEVLTVSAEHGRGMDDLQEAIAAEQDAFIVEPSEADLAGESENEPELFGIPRVAVVGRPNVGKSTLVNALLGHQRMITSPIPGTTVDPVDSVVQMGEHEFVLVDTAGVRRKSKTKQGIEVLSVVQTRKSLERADVAILVLDGETGISDQDEKIAGLVEEIGCGIILLMNKWDTQADNEKFTQELASERIRKKMAFLKYAPLLFASAKRNRGLENLGDLIDEVIQQRRVKISTHEFTEWVRRESTIHNPANARFYLCHQTGKNPPSFVCHVNDPEKIHFSLKRHLINAMRERWGFMGSPVRLNFVEANRRSLPSRVPRTGRQKGAPERVQKRDAHR